MTVPRSRSSPSRASPRAIGVLALALGGAGLAVGALALLEPPLSGGASTARGVGEVVGVLHVHTVASDGGGTVADVAAAARAGGLDFVLLTDHNRWGAPAWAYHDSLLLIVGEEVNTPHGHLLVAGGGRVGDRREGASAGAPGGSGLAPRPSVRPEEGLRIVAHPTGRPPWTGRDPAEFDGIEIWNADSERRNDTKADWAHALSLLPFRPMAALYRLLDHPVEELALWDRLLEERPVFGVCGVDAHHSLPLDRHRRFDLHFPAYRHSFDMARQHVLLDAELVEDARTDGLAVLEALRAGRSYCAFDGLLDARGARFTVRSGTEHTTLGGSVVWRTGARVEVVLPSRSVESRRIRIDLIRNGERVESREAAASQSLDLPGPGIYRLELTMERGRRRVPWILTNPIRALAASAGGLH